MLISLNDDPEIRNELISDFQYLEGHISLIANLTKIFWNEPTVEWVPENDEEKNSLQVFSAHFSKAFSNQPRELNMDIVKSMIKNKPSRDSLTVLMAFYRDGKAFFDNFKFIIAFYDFYYILEDLFGKGAWRNREVKKNFESSIELQDTIKWVLSNLIDSSDAHKREITTLLQEESLQYDVNGIIGLLVEMRGHLHHFSSRNGSTQKPNPLAEQNFEGLSLLTIAIANQSILKEIHKTEQ